MDAIQTSFNCQLEELSKIRKNINQCAGNPHAPVLTQPKEKRKRKIQTEFDSRNESPNIKKPTSTDLNTDMENQCAKQSVCKKTARWAAKKIPPLREKTNWKNC